VRDHLLLHLNGEPLQIRGRHVFQTLAGYLRTERRATGTKIVCEEGDCGTCTVLVGRAEAGALVYRPVNACILHLYQLDGTHVVTVEGLREADGALSEVQERMVEHHGAQCGFCTPGFITALAALFERPERPTEPEVREGLTGNLCRCTGYEPILTAARAVDPARLRRMNDRYPPAGLLAACERHAGEAVYVEAEGQTFFAPTDVEAAARFRADHADAVIVQGGTDVGVWCMKRAFVPDVVLALSKLPGLATIEARDGVLEVGGTATLAALEAFARERVPALHEILRHFGAPQIRHAGTLAGNLANASPIADTLPFLYVMEAEVELTGVNGPRRVDVRAFYRGYKVLDLAPDELITRVRIPLPGADETLRLYKVSKRLDLDISSFTAAVRMTRRGDTIEAVRIAYGGVGPVVYRLPRTEAFLTGRPFTRGAFAAAGQLAREEIAPITDVRGSRDFRLQLAENILLKFYHESAEVAA
jgi:xanthine dehydrogenase small subunit